MKKTYELGWLNVGDSFTFVGLSNYRNTSVRRVSDSGTTINGEVRATKHDSWKSVGPSYSVSNKSEVTID